MGVRPDVKLYCNECLIGDLYSCYSKFELLIMYSKSYVELLSTFRDV